MVGYPCVVVLLVVSFDDLQGKGVAGKGVTPSSLRLPPPWLGGQPKGLV